VLALYEVEGRQYLQLLDFRQQVRAQSSKYPPPPGECHADATQVRSRCTADAHLDGGGVGDGDDKASLPHSAREVPDWKTVQSFAAGIGLAEWRAEDEFNKLEANGWVDAKGHTLRKWQPYFTRVKGWWESEGRPMTRPAATSRNGRQTAAQRDAEKTGRTERVKVRQLMPDGSTKWI
jgi:hypothetical protein